MCESEIEYIYNQLPGKNHQIEDTEEIGKFIEVATCCKSINKIPNNYYGKNCCKV